MKPERYPGHVLDLFWSRDVISHVTTRLPMWGFLSVVNVDQASIWHGYWDIQLPRYWGHDFDILGSRDVIGHVTVQLPMGVFL